jgi:hypothetical protein
MLPSTEMSTGADKQAIVNSGLVDKKGGAKFGWRNLK